MQLNTEQQRVVDCNDKKMLCLAGAGTGKTATMLARIGRLISEGVDPKNILVLTFTNAAAFEMKNRFMKDTNLTSTPQFRTFHGFCYYLLCVDKEVREALGYSKLPSIATESQISQISTKAKLQLNIKLSENKLCGKAKLSPREARVVNLYHKLVRTKLHSDNLITFDIMLKDICNLFIQESSCVSKYFSMYKYIFIDEFQDTDPLQWKFVSAFKDANVMVVGDALQSIYAFRNADSSIIKKLADSDEWTTIKLFSNYRSTKQICKFANDLSSTYSSDSYRVAISSNVSGSKVSIKPYHIRSFIEIVDTDALEIIYNQITENKGKSVAILARTNAEVSEIQAFFKSKNITINSNSMLHVSNIIESVRSNTYLTEWLSTMLNQESYSAYVRLCTVDPSIDKLSAVISFFDSSVDSNVYTILNTVSRIRKIYSQTSKSLASRTEAILELLGYPNVSIMLPVPKDISYGQYILQCLQNQITDNIYIGTIHSAKGLEYDNVYLMGVQSRYFQLKDEQNLNLYYVGITRAKYKLTIFEDKDYS